MNIFPIEDAPIYLDDGSGVYHPVPFGGNPGQFWANVDANSDDGEKLLVGRKGTIVLDVRGLVVPTSACTVTFAAGS